MANIVNQYGQVKVGVRTQLTPPPSSLWTNVYSVYNADATGSSSLKTSLVAAYNGESNANDSFGSNNGTAVGGLTYTTGKIGNAFNLNGTNAYVSLSNDILNFTGDFSYSFWVYPNNTTNQQMLICNWKPGSTYGYGYYAYMVNNNLYFEIAQGNDISVYYVPLSWSSTWYNISITRKSSNNTKIYINGTLINGTYTRGNPTQNPVYQTGQINNIGTYNNGAGVFFNGKIDALNIWQKELTSAEVTELYNSGNGAQYIGDNFYKPTPNDALNTNNGTAQGGLTYAVGKVGTAFQFNGTNAYVALPDNSLNFTGDFSVSCWFYASTNTTNSSGLIGNYNDSASTGFGMYLYQNRLYAQLVNVSGKYSTTYVDNSVLGAWNHAVMVFKKGTGFYLYMNGVLRNSFTTANNANAGISPSYSATQKAYIGLLNYSGDWWWMQNGGKIDAANVWQKQLTQAEITELYNSGNGKQYTI